eukprot:3386902-Prymnesium_polylepis.1
MRRRCKRVRRANFHRPSAVNSSPSVDIVGMRTSCGEAANVATGSDATPPLLSFGSMQRCGGGGG